MKKNIFKGQTMLLAVMIVAAMSIAIGVSVAVVASSGANDSQKFRDSAVAKTLAETCLEDNLMKMSRGDFTPSSFTIAEGSCTIKISGNAPYVLDSIGIAGKSRRKIRATVSIDSEVLNIQSWGESY